MAKYFYSDCVITNVGAPQTLLKTKSATASAKINDRLAPKVLFSPEMYQYFRGQGNGKKHRIWFAVTKKKNPLAIISVQNEAGEINTQKIKTSDVTMAIGHGLLFATIIWASTYLFLPAFVGYQNRDYASFWVWVTSAAFFTFRSCYAISKISDIQSWKEGDINKFTQEIAPLFSKPTQSSSADNWTNS